MCLQCGYPSGSLSPSHPPLPFVPDARPRVFPRVEHFNEGGVQCSTAQTVPEQVEYRMVPTGASLEAARARSGIEFQGKTMAATFETSLASDFSARCYRPLARAKQIQRENGGTLTIAYVCNREDTTAGPAPAHEPEGD